MSSIINIFECIAGANGTIFDPGYRNSMMDLAPEWVFATDIEYRPWMGAMFGSILIGLTGVLPLAIISLDQTHNLKQGESANYLKTLLSFAVGGILGDVFLHSLPEIWANDVKNNGGQPSIRTGLLILLGLIFFVVAEKCFSVIEKWNKCNSFLESENNNVKGYNGVVKHIKEDRKRRITGYLNLIANTLDNFTHGLSLGGAFLASLRLGLLTTLAILVHEVPHEVGDFAILLKSGFSKFDAAFYQILTAGGGLIGAFVAIAASDDSKGVEQSWILPFSAGTFLHIALVTVLPDLLKEEDPKESFKQLLSLILGIAVMAVVTTSL